MSKYILRLDDAASKMNIENWNKMEKLLDKYNIKPLVGVIPDCKDPMMDEYKVDEGFWDKVKMWQEKGWCIALHGYEHVYCTQDGGINPVNKRSEFAGVSLEKQKEKIRKGVSIFKEHGINPQVFFAPSHTFDENTLIALKEESNIGIISDTVANDVYYQAGFYFIPQQSGRVRKLPFKVCTFCYHPNMMKNEDFQILEEFCKKNQAHFNKHFEIHSQRKKSWFDRILEKMYFYRR